MLFIDGRILLVGCICVELVDRGFQEGDCGENCIEGEGLVPELGIGLHRPTLQVFLLNTIREPAEECCGQDVAYGEAVTEPDSGFLALHLKGDSVHMY